MSRLVILTVIIAQAFTNDTSSFVKGTANKTVYADEGENITLDCHAKGQNDSNGDHCEWTKNTVPIYKNGRYRFINDSIADKENSTTVDKPREKDCSIQIINFTSKIDQGNWSCIELQSHFETNIQSKYFENYTVILKTTDKLHPEQAFATTKTNSIDEKRLLIYMTAAIGGAAIIIFIVTVVCLVKNKKRNLLSSDAIATASIQESSFSTDAITTTISDENCKRQSYFTTRNCFNHCCHRSHITKNISICNINEIVTPVTNQALNRAVEVDAKLYDDVLINRSQPVYAKILRVKAKPDGENNTGTSAQDKTRQK